MHKRRTHPLLRLSSRLALAYAGGGREREKLDADDDSWYCGRRSQLASPGRMGTVASATAYSNTSESKDTNIDGNKCLKFHEIFHLCAKERRHIACVLRWCTKGMVALSHLIWHQDD
jgi:hypothetical protein